MQARKVFLAAPLEIDVARIASFFPEFRYRAPYPADSISKGSTSEYICNDGDHDRFGVLYFDGKTENGFNTIYSDYKPRELAGLFSRLPQEISSQLISALKGTSLEIPPLSESELRAMKEVHDAKQARLQKLTSLQAPLRNAKMVNFKSTEAVTVLQHEYAVTNADSVQPIIGTFGAGPCVILALYDEQMKIAVLTHVDALTSIYSLSRLFSEITPENTVAHLAGGDFSSQDMCIEILELLESKGIKVVNADLANHTSFEAASLAIDSRTGVIYSPVRHDQLNVTPDISIRLQMAGMQFSKSPVKLIYNGLKSKKAVPVNDSLVTVDANNVLPLEVHSSKALPLTLGFLSTEKDRQTKPAQQPTYAGFKSGFLNLK